MTSDTNKQRRPFTDFKILTFDCYGTLIDWQTGILAALQPLLKRAASSLTPDGILETFARHELAQQTETPAIIYAQLLGVVHAHRERMGHQDNAVRRRSIWRVRPQLACISGCTGIAPIPETALQTGPLIEC